MFTAFCGARKSMLQPIRKTWNEKFVYCACTCLEAKRRAFFHMPDSDIFDCL